jgi:hypothetical protein
METGIRVPFSMNSSDLTRTADPGPMMRATISSAPPSPDPVISGPLFTLEYGDMLTAPSYLLRKPFSSGSSGQNTQFERQSRHDDAASAFL